MNLIIPPSSLGLIVPLMFFHKYGFSFKYPMKVDMPLNKETEPKFSCFLKFFQRV